MINQTKENEFKKCPVCNLQNLDNEANTVHNCPRCGKYEISCEARDYLRAEIKSNEEKRSLISHIIRSEGLDSVDKKRIIKIVASHRIPNPHEQINNLISFIAKETKHFGNSYSENYYQLRSLQSIVGAVNESNYDAIIIESKTQGIIEIDDSLLNWGENIRSIKLTMKGWEAYKKICSSESKQIFMAMRFKKENDDELEKNFLYTLYPKIQDAVREIGYTLTKINDVPHCGEITKRIEIEIRKSSCVIVDLTHGNLGAYWEAGFANGIGKKVIYICRDKELEPEIIHFDVNHYNIHPWKDSGDNSDFLNSLKAVIEAELFAQK